MIKAKYPVNRFSDIPTPFYYYDLDVLRTSLAEIKRQIEALEKGDIDLAAKYFAMDDNLSRKEWEDGLKQAQQEGRIEKIIKELKKAQPSSSQPGYETAYEFMILGESGLADYSVEMEFNQYSGVWKIKSM